MNVGGSIPPVPQPLDEWQLCRALGACFCMGGPSSTLHNFSKLSTPPPTPLITFLGYLHIFFFSTARLPKWAVAGTISSDSSQPQASERGWEVVQA